MEASLDVLPSPYGLMLDSADPTGAMTLLTWGGSYVNSDLTYYVSIHRLDFDMKELSVIDDQGNDLSFWNKSAALGTSPRFDISGLAKTERGGKMNIRYVFRVKAVVGTGADAVESEPAVLYSTVYGTYDNLISVADGNPAINSRHSLPREELTWIVDGEPLSGAIGSITEDSLLETGRIVGDSVADNIAHELRDGTLNRLPKELYVNDLYLNDIINQVVDGLEVSKENASLDSSAGIISGTVVGPNLSSVGDRQFNSNGPNVSTNVNQVTLPFATDVDGYNNLIIGTGLERRFTIVDILKGNNVIRKGYSYFVEINFSMNAVQDSSTTPNDAQSFNVKTEFRFTGLSGGDKVVAVHNVYGSWFSGEGTRASGYMYNHFATDNTYCYAVIEPMFTVNDDGTLKKPKVNCEVSCTDLVGNPTPVGIYSIDIRVTELF